MTPPAALPVTFRDARPGDEQVIAAHVRGVAAAEGLEALVSATPSDYARLMFLGDRVLHGVIAELAGAVVGSVLWYPTVSTYAGRVNLRIEDVFVEPAYRGRGLGRRLFAEMARRALEAGSSQLQWSVKQDNRPAIAFYERLGSETMKGFDGHRLTGAALTALAAS